MDIDNVRRTVSARLSPARRSELGQFFTPSSIARHMAGMFTPTSRPVSLFDAGAGVGSLIHAASGILDIACAEAWEIDEDVVRELRDTLSTLPFSTEVHCEDFLLAVPTYLAAGKSFDRAILNPPYRKLAASSHQRRVVESIAVPTVNLYTAFVVAAMALLVDGGELVAIIPRSCLNGRYHRPFREFVLDRASLDAIHVFNSRRAAFGDDAVLQENIIVKLTKGGEQKGVLISSSSDGTFSNLTSEVVEFSEVVVPGDGDRFIRLPSGHRVSAPHVPLETLGIKVSTGPLVEFRMLDALRTAGEGVPVVSPRHLSVSGLEHPSDRARFNFVSPSSSMTGNIWPSGHYVVVKRISSKESNRRIVAFHVKPSDIAGDRVVFENHLNVFHSGKRGLSPDIAERLCAYLNSEVADQEFRCFSGSTQVNATDLRAMSYPI